MYLVVFPDVHPLSPITLDPLDLKKDLGWEAFTVDLLYPSD